jgi:hypothetical protein
MNWGAPGQTYLHREAIGLMIGRLTKGAILRRYARIVLPERNPENFQRDQDNPKSISDAGKSMPKKTKSLSVPEALRGRYEEITAVTDTLCKEQLNEEYAQVCREMTATLARKRPSPPGKR